MKEMNRLSTITTLRILYPFWVLIGIFSIIYVPSTLIESGDAIATTQHISNNTILFRFGIAGSLITQLLFVIIPLLLYRLLEAVNKNAAILMVVLALISVPITMFNEANKLMITHLLDEPDRVRDTLDMYHEGMTISMIFWGLWLLPLGWLVYKSTLFPKMIAVFLFVGGFGYLLGSFMEILFPEFKYLATMLEYMTFGELIFIIWLVFMGVE